MGRCRIGAARPRSVLWQSAIRSSEGQIATTGTLTTEPSCLRHESNQVVMVRVGSSEEEACASTEIEPTIQLTTGGLLACAQEQRPTKGNK